MKSPDMQFDPADIWKSADACLENARTLMYHIEMSDPAQAYALGILAREEIVKALILHLVRDGVLPWNKSVLRSLNDHKCKQSWFIVLDALISDLESNSSSGSQASEVDSDGRLMSQIADVLNWYRWDKIYRWETGYSDWEEKPAQDNARAIVSGKLDRSKQRALYVEIGEDGKVISDPKSIPAPDVAETLKTTRKYYDYVFELPPLPLSQAYLRKQIQWLKGILNALFEPEVPTGEEDLDSIPGVRIYQVSRVVLRPPNG